MTSSQKNTDVSKVMDKTRFCIIFLVDHVKDYMKFLMDLREGGSRQKCR